MPTLKSIRRAYRALNRQQSGKRIAELRKLAKQRAKRLREKGTP
jgi:hypothetical protein